jgi:hypothetical protein
MRDTLIYDSSGLHFELMSDWKGIVRDKMSVKKNDIFQKNMD